MNLWLDTCGDDLTPRASLPGDTDADVAIVGAGYTGLWTAYYLAEADPTLRIVVLEKEFAGFGASGRNGGWCSAFFAAPWPLVARIGGRAGVQATHRAMIDTVAEIGRIAPTLPIDCHFHQGGTLALATTPAHVHRLQSAIADAADWGLPPDDHWLTPTEAQARIAAPGTLGAAYTPHCARIHPAALARGLARAVETQGTPIHENTPAIALSPGRVETPSGVVRAEVTVRATEAYTATLPGHHRTIAPLYSLMIATEPLPDTTWDTIGWRDNETLTDGRHLLIYAQRTPDNRIAFGGRGAPYHWRSRLHPTFDHDPQVFAALEETLHALLPATRDAAITHRWGGPLAVPRDWFPSVGLNRTTGQAWAGGYVGDGVATTNLAARTLTDLILNRDTPLTHLPWVNHNSPRWEPEPLRWLGINLGRHLATTADRSETRTGRPTLHSKLLTRLLH